MSGEYFYSIMNINVKLEKEEYINQYEESDLELDLREFDSFIDFSKILSLKMDYKINQNKNYFQIFYENSWINLIDLASLYFVISNNYILGIENKIKIGIKNRSIKNCSNSDSLNTLNWINYENDHDGLSPNEKLYDTSECEVFCALCEISSNEETLTNKLGPIYDYKNSGKNYYFHENCILWSPRVYLDDNRKLKNVNSEIKRSKKIECSYCGKFGAGIGCYLEECDKSFHYLCAKTVGCAFKNNDSNYRIYCRKHLHHLEEIFYCQKNLTQAELSNSLCFVCSSGSNEDKILICDSCGIFIHSFCCEPPIDEIPEGDFFCKYCAKKGYKLMC